MTTLILVANSTGAMDVLSSARPFLLVVIIVSALIGFLTARFIYKGQVRTRTRELRAEYVLSRRRLSDTRSSLAKARDEHARVVRRMKREQYSLRSVAQPQQ